MSSVRTMVSNVRCVYPKLFVADEFQGNKRYSIGLLLDEANLNAIKAAIKTAVENTFPGKSAQMIKAFSGSRQQWPLKTLDDGTTIITPKRREANGAPLVIDQKRQNIPADRGLPYGGCWVNVSIDVSCYTKSGAGVTAYLNGVQLVKEDAPLGGGATAGSCRNDFEEIETPSSDPFSGKDDSSDDDIF